MQRILIVRLGSLGDLVHALPAVAAVRAAHPAARLDWLVDARHRAFLRLIPIVDTIQEWHAPSWRGWGRARREIARLRAVEYDVAVDLQGLIKSAMLARLSGARRVLGFSRRSLREPAARWLYGEVVDPVGAVHVIAKNRALVRAIGATTPAQAFPVDIPDSAVPDAVRLGLGGPSERFVLLNPGAAWPNKRWPAARFGQLARRIRWRHHLRSVVVWGPGEQALAGRVVQASDGAAVEAPATSVGDLVALSRAATVMVAGDTGPFHIAAAVGTPVVGIFGPTSPARNGPWSSDDRTISRFDWCACHHCRRCRSERWCLESVGVEQVEEAVDRRMAGIDDGE